MAIGALRGVPAEGVADKQQSGENRSGLLGSEGETSPCKLNLNYLLTKIFFCAKFTITHSPIV